MKIDSKDFRIREGWRRGPHCRVPAGRGAGGWHGPRRVGAGHVRGGARVGPDASVVPILAVRLGLDRDDLARSKAVRRGHGRKRAVARAEKRARREA